MFFRRGKFISVALIIAASLGVLGGLSFLIYDSLSASAAKKIERKSIPERASDILLDTKSSVLIISSYNSMLPSSVQEINGITEVFVKNYIRFDIEYMDAVNYPFEEVEKLFYQNLKFKLAHRNQYDAVVTFGDQALLFMEKYRNEFFQDEVLFFADAVRPELAFKVVADVGISGILKTDTFERTLHFAFHLLPYAKKIVALTDNSQVGVESLDALKFAMRKYPTMPLEVIDSSKYTLTDLAFKLKSIDKDSIFLFLIFSTDKNGKKYSIGDSSDIVSRYVGDIPIFSTNKNTSENRFLGGSMYDYKKAGALAGKILSEALLEGKNISSYGLISDFGSYNFINHEVFKRFGFNESLIDKKSTIVDRRIEVARAKIVIPFLMISLSLLMLFVISCIYYFKANRAQILVNLRNNAIGRKNRQLQESEERFKRLCEFDFLTAIPNRSYADREINECFKRKIPFSIFHIDVDGFKNFNDYYTHDCGDFVLKEISSRLTYLSEKLGCFVARYGGDEFLLIYKNGCLENGSEDFALIKSVMNKSCIYKNLNLDLTVSGGVANYYEGISFDELASNADLAMYEAKKRGKGNICFFRPEMKDEIKEKNRISMILERACSQKSFSIKYQPLINTRTGELDSYEALVRLTGENIEPAKFIPVAEESGYITVIGRIVTEKVIEQMAKWRLDGMKIKKVAINYSIGQLVDLDYVDYLHSLLKKFDIDPKFIEIEITESLLMENKKLAGRLFESLSKIGVNLVLDDFGTGYSSLSYLTYLPVKKVKVDKSLIDNYLVEEKCSFIENIVRLVHDLGMELAVEGVENNWQYEKLRQLECDYIQGYYFSRPISGEEVEAFSFETVAS